MEMQERKNEVAKKSKKVKKILVFFLRILYSVKEAKMSGVQMDICLHPFILLS